MSIFTLLLPSRVFDGIIAAIDRNTAQAKRVADLLAAADQPEIPDSIGDQLAAATASGNAAAAALQAAVDSNTPPA